MSLCGETQDARRLQVDATSLADLKAELFRKKGEAVKNRQKGNYRPEKQNTKKANIWSKENTGLLARLQKDLEKKKEEERSQERSRIQLEKKTRLYNSLKEGKGRSSVAGNFLVEFGGKDDSDDDEGRDYPAKNESEEWVEYTDALGRTRSCMKKDLQHLKKQDKDLKREEDKDRDDVETGEGLRKEEPDLLSEDMRRDMLREKWELQEMENLKKNELHYGDVLYDEARTHGAGYYNFSNDENKRAGEQSTLKNLHEETDEMRRQKAKKAEKKEREIKERVKKATAKRRAKAGLPPLESDSDSDEDDKKYNSDDDVPEDDISKSVLEGLKLFRRNNEEEERRANEAKRVATSGKRDWDNDKEDVSELAGKEWRVMEQKEWNTKQRQERQAEFAPPSAYSEARWLLKQKEDDMKHNKKMKMTTPPIPMSRTAMPPPPPPSNFFIDKTPGNWPGDQFKHPPPSNGQFSVPPPGIHIPPTTLPSNSMDYLDANPEQEESDEPVIGPLFPSEEPQVQNQYSKYMKMELQKRMKKQGNNSGMSGEMLDQIKAFQEESDDSDDDNEKEDNNQKRGKRAEIAPPCDMEYYSSTQGKSDYRQGYRSHEDMADAVNAGWSASKN